MEKSSKSSSRDYNNDQYYKRRSSPDSHSRHYSSHHHSSSYRSSSRRERTPENQYSDEEMQENSTPKYLSVRKTFFDVTPQMMTEMGLPILHVPTADTETSLILLQANKNAVAAGNNIKAPTVSIIQQPLSTAQQKQAKRIYVGNIPRDCNEMEITLFFNTAMRQNGLIAAAGDPVQSVQLNMEKNYVFVDFRSPEEATRAMSLDGIKMRDHILKVKRPNNYVAPMTSSIISQVNGDKVIIPGAISTNVLDGPNKLFIGGLPGAMSEDQVRDLLLQFGQLKAFNLVKDSNTGLSKGYAFCDFVNGDVTDKAIQVLNGLEMGGKKLVVQRASIGAKSNQIYVDPLEYLTDPERQAIANLLNPQIPVQAALANLQSQGLLFVEPTRILVLLNLVSEKELEDDEEFEELVSDIKAECSKYGPIRNVIIPRPEQDVNSENYYSNKNQGVGKVLVEYETKEQAKQAQTNLAGRKYNGRIVVTSYYPEERYFQQEY